MGSITMNYDSGMNKLKKYLTRSQSNIFVYTVQCSLYSTGMYISNKWSYTRGFVSKIDYIVAHMKRHKCRLEHFKWGKIGICTEYMKLWIDLFNTYGTHIITRSVFGRLLGISRIKAGGKMLYINSENVLSTEEIVSVESFEKLIGKFFIEVESDKKKNKQKYVKNTSRMKFETLYTVGGDLLPDKEGRPFNGWKRSLNDNPMPIKLELTPIAHFISIDLAEIYYRALNIYRQCFNASNGEYSCK
ncbi:Membrane attack complex component-perforin (MACPF) domain [Babesia duncani]|uniref:Membrane attack complex component-perforin (MACPF) domain n=1 Tax=Babesia duncani TaxID=323732 RepID=A0AAD9PJ72_9APIC|nr:Membrane attack complex component-perforin (MACPF) domain [Babesia duncani]